MTHPLRRYGVAIGSLGMLSNLATCLTIDVYGPIADNAGGMAEMSEFPESVREKTDALDAAGNTTAAIGKGFAIGSAALVSLALIGAFVARCDPPHPPHCMSLPLSLSLSHTLPLTLVFSLVCERERESVELVTLALIGCLRHPVREGEGK